MLWRTFFAAMPPSPPNYGQPSQELPMDSFNYFAFGEPWLSGIPFPHACQIIRLPHPAPPRWCMVCPMPRRAAKMQAESGSADPCRSCSSDLQRILHSNTVTCKEVWRMLDSLASTRQPNVDDCQSPRSFSLIGSTSMRSIARLTHE
jgi:hypothetical protein